MTERATLDRVAIVVALVVPVGLAIVAVTSLIDLAILITLLLAMAGVASWAQAKLAEPMRRRLADDLSPREILRHLALPAAIVAALLALVRWWAEIAQALLDLRPYAHVIGPTVIIVSALGALWGVLVTRATTRRRATLDIIEKTESTEYYQKNFAVYLRYRDGERAVLHDPKTPEAESDRKAFLDFLNHYEIIAIGIEQGILDEQFYKDWMRSALVRHWNIASDFIQRERWKHDPATGLWSYSGKLFEKFQNLATAWSRDAVRLDKTTGGPPAQPAGPGDEPLPQ